jgi:7-keto-8-aminopelargonate synthetase-like enzyme
MITLKSGVGTTISSGGRSFLYFAGNNYLGLANNREIIGEAVAALEKYGVSVSASRQTTGTSDLHLELERELSFFKGGQDSVVFASGYMGNKILAETLRGSYTAIVTDGMAHASILDSVAAIRVPQFIYRHCDAEDLARVLKENAGQRMLIITDGIFALTGDIAPLDQIYGLARKYSATLIVDDAHATGVLGKNGRGTPEHFNLDGAQDIYQSETMSKAIGSYGGFITANRELLDKIRSDCHFYGASTALPPPVVAAGLASVRMIRQHPELRLRLLENADRLRAGVKELGYETSDTVAPVIPIYFKTWERAMALSGFLEENLIIVPAVNYPVKIDKFIVRATVSASHTNTQIDKLLDTLKTWRSSNGIN